MSNIDTATDAAIEAAIDRIRNATVEACVALVDVRVFVNRKEHLDCIAAMRKLKVENDHA